MKNFSQITENLDVANKKYVDDGLDKLARVAQSKNLIDLDFFTKNARTFSRGGVFKKIKPKLEELNADDWDKIGSFFLRWSGFYYDCEIKNF